MKKLMSFALFLGLVGCSCINSCIPDRSCEYQKSPCLSPLTIPPQFRCSAQVGDDFTIPHLRRARAKPCLLPPDSLALQVAEGKLSKKDLKRRERESGLTQITWTKTSCDTPALLTSEPLPSMFHHLQRALNTVAKLYPIKSKYAPSGTFCIYDLVATNGTMTPSTPLYRLQLVELEEGTMVTLTAESQMVPTVNVTQRILGKVYEALDDTKEGLSLKQWLFS